MTSAPIGALSENNLASRCTPADRTVAAPLKALHLFKGQGADHRSDQSGTLHLEPWHPIRLGTTPRGFERVEHGGER